MKCMGEFQRAENAPSWKGGEIKRICEMCRQPFFATRYEVERGKARFCSSKCYGKWERGGNNPSWRGGTSFEPYCAKFNNRFKEAIRDKFDRKCFICGIPENGRKLCVHHVNYNKDCLCSDNITCQFVPLCPSCHSKTNANREYWQSLIMNKLAERIDGWYI